MNDERHFQMKPNNPMNSEKNIMVKNIPPDLERSLQLKLGLINCNNEYIAGPPIIKEPPPPRDPNYKPFRCTECNYAAARLGRLNVHKKIHSADRPYKCNSCSYSAKDKSNLRKHIRIHTGDKLFKCNSCSYMSTQFSHMNIHQRIHTGVKPFKCSRCNYAATDKSNLKRHERIHSCDRPYKCMYCNYSAVQIGSLRRHSKIHKQMKCTHCDYTTADASYLKLHEMTHSATADNVDLNVPSCDDMHVVEPCSTSTQTDKRLEPVYPDHDDTCTSIASSDDDDLTNHSKSDMGCSPPDTQDYM